MTNVFISYASKDRERARRLASALGARGWSVWWDPRIRVGQDFDEVIERELDAAKTIVVLWSNDSISSKWVRTEAAFAAQRGILVPVLMDSVKLPLEFRRKQTADLIEWDGSSSHHGFQAFCEALEGMISGAEPPHQSPTLSDRPFRWNRTWTFGCLAAIVIASVGAYIVLSSMTQTSKPLEGVWVFSMNYTRFHEVTGDWSSEGTALILWKDDAKRYAIYSGYEVNARGNNYPILAGFSRGYIEADAEGWPPTTFGVHTITYIARMHRERKDPSTRVFRYKDCSIDSKGDRVVSIKCTFETSKSYATLHLTWGSSLH